MSDQYLSNQIGRVLQTFIALAGHETTGLTISEMANKLETTPSQTLRDLTNLQNAKLAERCPWDNNRWRIGPMAAQISHRVRIHLEQAQLQLQQDITNYSKVF